MKQTNDVRGVRVRDIFIQDNTKEWHPLSEGQDRKCISTALKNRLSQIEINIPSERDELRRYFFHTGWKKFLERTY
jgi:hypothetical protein